MGLINDLLTKTIDQLANITDATHDTDPLGTLANDAYFKQNVHNYLKQIGTALQRQRKYFVNPLFLDENADPLGTPLFLKIQSATSSHSCYTQASNDGSGANNKVLIEIGNKADAYDDNLNFTHNGFITLKGESKRNCIISGTVTVTTGIHIFEKLKFTNDITISGGIVVFDNCLQTDGGFNVSGSATIVIKNADQWGAIEIENLLSGVKLWLLNVSDIRLPGSGTTCIEIPNGVSDFEGVIRNVRMQGEISDPGSHIDETFNVKENAIAFPTI